MSHSLKLFFVGIFLALTAHAANADRLCLKLTISKGRVKQTTKTVTTTCPSGYKQLIDTSTLVGSQGPTGATGADGGFSATLPSGQLMKGVFGGFAPVTGAGQYLGLSHTFPFSLTTGVIAGHYLTTGQTATAECPGSATAPDAIAGHLCLYESSQFNRSGQAVFSTSTGNTASENWKSGFTVWATSTGANGYISFYGSYAVRAQ